MSFEALVVLSIFVIVAAFIEWLQQRTDSPIMRKRVNEASDEYLSSRQTPLGQALSALGFSSPSRDEGAKKETA